MDTLLAIKTRKSIRNYKSQAVEADKIETILKAANNAPKAGDFHISVILNADILGEINDKALEAMKNSGNDFLMSRAAIPGYQPLYGAPMLILFSASPENPYGMANVSNAATTASIAATALNLGSCYVVTPTLALNADSSLADKTGLPAGFKVMCGLLLGYAGEEKFATPKEEANNINYCR